MDEHRDKLPAEMKEALHRAAAILEEEGAREVYVFGSVARGLARAESDLDLAVVGLPSSRYFRAVGRLLCEVEQVVDVIMLDRPTPFTRHLRESGTLRRVA